MDLSLVELLKNNSWKNVLNSEFEQNYFLALETYLGQEQAKNKIIYPARSNIFEALNLLDLHQVKVVILGQDPYHGCGEAHGLSFSVPRDIKIPPSLRNILKELESDLKMTLSDSGDLTSWVKQGVLLLNSVLTVEKDKPHSHRKRGWETFTDKIISAVSLKNDHVVFILWGKPAQEKIGLIDLNKHLVLESVHPSPLSSYRGFFGSQPFSRANTWLAKHSLSPINWMLNGK
ncbi:MAG: uracil-DNA glycosylase [Moraxellaceae bacterium]|nr:uracil-DNA glycosylase [Pseudobdellovibrionaceae bacterium]